MYILQPYPSTSSSIYTHASDQYPGSHITGIPSHLLQHVRSALPAIQEAIAPHLPAEVIPLCNQLFHTWVLASIEEAEYAHHRYPRSYYPSLPDNKQFTHAQHRGLMPSRLSRWILRPFKKKTAHVAPLDSTPKRNISEPLTSRSSSSSSSECSCLLTDETAAAAHTAKLSRQKFSGIFAKLGKRMKTAVSRRQIDQEGASWTRFDLSHKLGVDVATQTAEETQPQELALVPVIRREKEDVCSTESSYNSADEEPASSVYDDGREDACSSDKEQMEEDEDNGEVVNHDTEDVMSLPRISGLDGHLIQSVVGIENRKYRQTCEVEVEGERKMVRNETGSNLRSEAAGLQQTDSIQDLLSLNYPYFQFTPSVHGTTCSISKTTQQEKQLRKQQQQQMIFQWQEPNTRQLQFTPNFRTPWSPPAGAAPAVLPARPIKTSKTDMDMNFDEPVPFPKIGLGRQNKENARNTDKIQLEDLNQYCRSVSSLSVSQFEQSLIPSSFALQNVILKITCVLYDIICRNHAQREFNFDSVFSISPFIMDCKHDIYSELPVTTWNDVYNQLTYVFTHGLLTTEHAIITLIYVERMLTRSGQKLCDVSWRLILLAAILVAVKTWDDCAVFNADFSHIFFEADLSTICDSIGSPVHSNYIERRFLAAIDWNVTIRSSSFAERYFTLREMEE
ncbi:hypothetical protein EC973_001472 [Apophysomyces ossiformis]|uniref:Cyclin N-terminal domain-containing protein n=1 Tax=Apophysomyces ossiformis TaxID=679940 RepID=A0A8H7ENI5_9FUNG|nr:hypothetical protein EC973_001472 [Apophysomyces ossiformis]